MQRGNSTVRGRASLQRSALLAIVLMCGAAGAQAQDYDTGVAWGGGYLKFAPFVEQGSATPIDLGLGGTPVAVLQADFWRWNRWVALRVGGFYSHGEIDFPTTTKNVSAYGGEVAGMLRVVPPSTRRMVTAYLMAGGGFTYFALGEENGGRILIDGTNVTYDEDDAGQWMLLGGGGLEFLTGYVIYDGLIGVRLEAVDMMTLHRPLRELDAERPGATHNLRFSVTVFSGVPKLF